MVEVPDFPLIVNLSTENPSFADFSFLLIYRSIMK